MLPNKIPRAYGVRLCAVYDNLRELIKIHQNRTFELSPLVLTINSPVMTASFEASVKLEVIRQLLRVFQNQTLYRL